MATLSIKELTSCIMSFMILAGDFDRRDNGSHSELQRLY